MTRATRTSSRSDGAVPPATIVAIAAVLACLGTVPDADAQTVRRLAPAQAAPICPSRSCLADAIGRAGSPTQPPQQLLRNGTSVAAGTLIRSAAGNPFTVVYDPGSTPGSATLTYSIAGGSTFTTPAADLDAGALIGILARGRNSGAPATLTDLVFNGTALDAVEPGLGTLASNNTFATLTIANFDPAVGWTLTGTAMIVGGRGEAPRFEVQVSDEPLATQLGSAGEVLYVYGRPLVTDAATLAGDVDVGSTMVFEQIADGTFAGSIAGAGDVVKTGPGTLVLDGANTYAGGTALREGALILGNDDAIGTRLLVADGGTQVGYADGVTIANGVELRGTVALDQPAGSVTQAGAVSGVGGLIKTGAGTLTLSGTNSYDGATRIEAGTLALLGGSAVPDGSNVTLTGGTLLPLASETIGALSGTGGTVEVGAGRTLIFGTAADASFAGEFVGEGDLVKRGAGTAVLTGASASFAGTTRIAAGSLGVEGILGGLVRVDPSAVLTGRGTVGALDVLGTVAPGAPPAGAGIASLGVGGTGMRSTGDVRFASGSKYRLDLNAGGRSGTIAADGTVAIEGGTVAANGLPGDYPAAASFPIVIASGGVTGTFDRVIDNLPDVDLTDRYGPNTVELFYRQATPPDQGPGPTPVPVPVVSPKDVYPSTVLALAETGRVFAEMLQRQGALGIKASEEHAGIAMDNALNGPIGRDAYWNSWAATMGAGASVEATGTVADTFETGFGPGFGASAYGLATGFEARWNIASRGSWTHELLGGIAIGTSRTSVETERAIASHAEVDALHVGLYGTVLSGPVRMSGALAYARLEYGFDRTFALNDGRIVTATAATDGNLFEATATASYNVAPLLDIQNWQLAPTASVDAIHVTRDSLADEGIGMMGLNVASDTISRTYVGVGLIAGTTVRAFGIRFEPEASVMYERTLGDDSTIAFSTIPMANARFTSWAPSASRDRLRVGMGVEAILGDRASAHARYDGSFSSNVRSHRASIGLRLAF